MSTLNVNQIESSQGGVVIIPTGYTLSVGGLQINEDTMPPSPSGNANKALYTDGSAISYNLAGPDNIRVYNTSGQYIPPSNVTKFFVMVVGGGGAASGYSESGGAGGYSERLLTPADIGSSIQVTVGTGSTSYSTYSGAAGQGNTSSFGSLCSATGGLGGNQSHRHCGGVGGTGSGGDLNIYGGGGTGHTYYGVGHGGGSYFGGGSPCGHPNGGNYAYNHRDRAAPGAGGAGGYRRNNHGSTGKDGIVVIYEYI